MHSRSRGIGFFVLTMMVIIAIDIGGFPETGWNTGFMVFFVFIGSVYAGYGDS